MAVADANIDLKLLESAKNEFLEKGFENASLREICRNAGTTTGALYNRYKGKDELFAAVIKPTTDAIDELCAFMENRGLDYLNRNSTQDLWYASEDTTLDLIRFLYQNFEGIKMLLCKSEGSIYANFFHNLIKLNVNAYYSFLKTSYQKGIIKSVMDKDELHIFLTAYWTSLFEPVIHDYSLEKALKYGKDLSTFFNWQSVLGF